MVGDTVREIERLLGICGIAKGFRPRMLINIKNVKKVYIEIYLRFGNYFEME